MRKRSNCKWFIWVMIICLIGGTSLQAKTVKRSDISFQQMQYEKVDKSEVDTLAAEGAKLVQCNDLRKFQEWEYNYYALYRKITANAQLAYLYYQLDTTDTYFYKEYLYCVDLIGKMKTQYLAMFEGKEAASSEEMTEYYRLSSERKELEDQYTNLQYTVQTDVAGKKMTIIDIAKDNKLSVEKKRELMLGSWYDTYNEKAGEIFLKLVKLDNQMSKLAHCTSTADYMYKQYDRDYTPADSSRFIHYVKEYVPQIYNELAQSNEEGMQELMEYTYHNEDELLNVIDGSFIKQYPQLQEAYDYLRKYGLYDITPGSRKASGGFTTYLSGYEEPFISLNYANDYATATALIHEFGHFNFEYTTGNSLVSLDMGETYSQGLELLAFPYYNKIMGSDKLGREISLNVMTEIIRAIIDGCVYEEFLQKVYAEPDMAVEDLNDLYGRITEEYGLNVDKRSWVEVVHNFQTPFYYLSYSMSAIAALEIWQQSIQDYHTGMQTYLDLIKVGTQYDFQQALKEAGLSSPFVEGTVEKVMNEVTACFTMTETQSKKAA